MYILKEQSLNNVWLSSLNFMRAHFTLLFFTESYSQILVKRDQYGLNTLYISLVCTFVPSSFLHFLSLPFVCSFNVHCSLFTKDRSHERDRQRMTTLLWRTLELTSDWLTGETTREIIIEKKVNSITLSLYAKGKLKGGTYKRVHIYICLMCIHAPLLDSQPVFTILFPTFHNFH